MRNLEEDERRMIKKQKKAERKQRTKTTEEDKDDDEIAAQEAARAEGRRRALQIVAEAKAEVHAEVVAQLERMGREREAECLRQTEERYMREIHALFKPENVMPDLSLVTGPPKAADDAVPDDGGLGKKQLEPKAGWVSFRLRWAMSGEIIESHDRDGGGLFLMSPHDWVVDFIEDLDRGDIPGVPAVSELSEGGHYKLLWRGEVLEEQSFFLEEMQEETLFLDFARS